MATYNIIAKPSLKRHFFEFFADGIVLALNIAGLIFGLNYFNEDFHSIIWGIFILVLVILVATGIYRLLKTKMFVVALNKQGIEFRHGVFTKTVESIDMHRIKDFIKKRSVVDQIFGLAKIVILSTDQTTPKVTLDGLYMNDAEKILDFLQIYASDSIVKHYINRGDRAALDAAVAAKMKKEIVRKEP
ncbi:PH domain-containing protein [Candidatus Dojkabacteria bacterium]|uniref:PH domain-containing protein n=1 Tax=Candidatus Dojkabacteria bacterium TaxID=2099670 RepID=A0A955RKL7_9BACT|nr:PH domain-containing protein [Candidatus Dojkabacteria bacterium]